MKLLKRIEEQITATGFLRNGMVNEEGAIIPEQFRIEGMFDRMDAVGKAVLGLSLQCAQCHTHKYDPISQKEYYQLFAFLNQTEDADKRDESPLLSFFTDDQKKQRATWEADLAAAPSLAFALDFPSALSLSLVRSPIAKAAGQVRSGSTACTRTATPAVVKTTRPTESSRIERRLALKSTSEVLRAAEYSSGGSSPRSTISGSSSISGTTGT